MTEVNDYEFNVPAPLPVVNQRLIDDEAVYGIPEDISTEILLESIRAEQERQKKVENESLIQEQMRLLEESQRRDSERRITEREEKYQRILLRIKNLMKFISGDVSDVRKSTEVDFVSDLLFVESIIRQYIRHSSDTLFISYTDYQRFTTLIHKNFREGEYIDLFTVIRKIPSLLCMNTQEDEVDEEAETFDCDFDYS